MVCLSTGKGERVRRTSGDPFLLRPLAFAQLRRKRQLSAEEGLLFCGREPTAESEGCGSGEENRACESKEDEKR